jgi:hypothetical protein
MKNKEAKQRGKKSRCRWWWIGVLVLIGIAMGGNMLHRENEKPGEMQRIPTELTGRWQRPDGGYILELTDIGSDGQVNAAYFNPRPINVSRSQWQHKEGRLELFVELRDVNYPGSTYTLAYQHDRGRLYGVYFQAAMGQMFEVKFVRAK